MPDRRTTPPKGTRTSERPSGPGSGSADAHASKERPSSVSSLPASPPSSVFDLDIQDAITLKGIAGSPGVAVGPALVLGDLRASFVRRHVHTAQIPQELERVQQGV